jgi:hypothetical protein
LPMPPSAILHNTSEEQIIYREWTEERDWRMKKQSRRKKKWTRMVKNHNRTNCKDERGNHKLILIINTKYRDINRGKSQT